MSGSITAEPAPRRGAPKSHRHASVSSIPTVPGGHDDSNSDYSGSDHEHEPPVSQDVVMSDQQPVSQEDQEDRWTVVRSLLPDFVQAMNEFKLRLENGDYEKKAFAIILQTRRGAFQSFFEAFAESEDSTFINFSWLQELRERTGADTSSVISASIRANLIVVLDRILDIKDQLRSRNSDSADKPNNPDILKVLKCLDDDLPRLLSPPWGSFRRYDLALAIRACYSIELLAGQSKRADVGEVIARVFCLATNSTDYPHLFTKGPFKSLTGDGQVEESDPELCHKISIITEHVFSTAFRDKRNYGLDELRAEYPLRSLLDKIWKWCLDSYIAAAVPEEPSESAAVRDSIESWKDDFEDAPETQESVPESVSDNEPTIRPPVGIEKKQSYVDRGGDSNVQSFRGLQQQHAAPPPDAPSDYASIADSILLSDRPISTHKFESGRFGQKRSGSVSVSASDEDEDEVFQTDGRNIDPDRRRAQIKASNPLPNHSKRQRLPSHQPTSNMPPLDHPASDTSRRTPYNNSASPPAPLSSQANFANIKTKVADAQARARYRAIDKNSYLSSAPSSSRRNEAFMSRQRQSWSETDTNLLIELIAKHRAKWSIIEQRHNSDFQYPRNQQAYRDKARLLKVEFLIADVVLPPCFDLVALGRKETDKLVSMGKNPLRKENDIDAHGKAINTDIPAS
ncbi:hypothetical protein QQS21_010671 [Conoideocrella luteorostrata]|uniref:Myb-like domain-containing protein n=1 Tax=Conoideocrella luteorostrata TaxID=1105319 RepID=A0AAJ0FTZ5_9HYPO|nr:hypothetical protein QQS21_010671 [Conoideocrella luteorostrata]